MHQKWKCSCCCISHQISPMMQHLLIVTRCLQANLSPNDGACAGGTTTPLNELLSGAFNGKPVSYRFYLNQNSNACRLGVTTMAMIPNKEGGVSADNLLLYMLI